MLARHCGGDVASRMQGSEDDTKMMRRHAILVGATLLTVTLTAFAQQNKQNQRSPEERREAMAAAVKAVGLSQDQMAKIREIRRMRPPEGTTGRDRREWVAGRLAKIQAVLTDDQKAKVGAIQEAGESQEHEGVILLGLARRQRANP